jgi:hypothetical protein
MYMSDTRSGNRGRTKQKIPRIEPPEAARVLAQCEHLFDSSVGVETQERTGFARFLAPLNEQILELAVQPDSWGERTRARLISEVFAIQRDTAAESASVEEILKVSNILVPCFLLELGRRRQHIAIEFPNDPCDSAARFGLRAGPSCPLHFVNGKQLVRLVAEAGEELVGLCYFGDQQSRDWIEARLTLVSSSSSSSETKH